jgi:hypothetical protein
VCAQKLLAASEVIYPQFATHNAQTLATMYTWASAMACTDYEFQCLHGMGESLYDQVVGKDNLGQACRIYAPVGTHQTLLAYLVRRLLENGANSSFVNQIVDEAIAGRRAAGRPGRRLAREQGGQPHVGIPLPLDMFGGSQATRLVSTSPMKTCCAKFQQRWRHPSAAGMRRRCWRVPSAAGQPACRMSPIPRNAATSSVNWSKPAPQRC